MSFTDSGNIYIQKGDLKLHHEFNFEKMEFKHPEILRSKFRRNRWIEDGSRSPWGSGIGSSSNSKCMLFQALSLLSCLSPDCILGS